MPVSMSALVTPALLQGLEALHGLLGKAAAFAAETGIAESTLLEARLFPDMFPMVRQVQIATDTAKGAVARLSGTTPPSYPDDEISFAALIARVARTIDFVRSVPGPAIDGSEERVVTLQGRARTMTFRGEDYLLSFALPNFYFHLATAYGLLRQAGVVIGKPDYLGAVRLS